MKRFLTLIVATLVSMIALTAPAGAVIEPTPDITAIKFWDKHVCVGSTLDPASYPVAAMAQQWNVVTNPSYGTTALELHFSTNCAADGYQASRRMVIGTFSNPDYGCLYFTNLQTVDAGGAGYTFWWTNGPGAYINVGNPACVSTAFRRSHQTSAAIGHLLGLKVLTSAGWASRVMCTCSTDTVRAPTSAEGNRMFQIYTGSFGD